MDLLRSTGHDRFASSDYAQLAEQRIHAARDGLRWHLIETAPGHYDWSSFLPMLRAASDADVEVVWDLCHYGWPDDIDIWSSAFVERFARFAAAAAEIVRDESDGVPFYCPVNEISFWAWAGGQVGRINPVCHGRGGALKQQLVRAAIAGIEAVRSVDPRARFLYAEPAVHVAPGSEGADDRHAAENYRLAQFEAYDMLSGRMDPALGGRPDYLDILGLNFYPDNQWYLGGPTIPMGHHAYRPLRELLAEFHARYDRPIVITETGAEGTARPAWLYYVCTEVRAALLKGVPIEGICLYPILDYPGWDNDRSCAVGLFSHADEQGERSLSHDFADEVRRQQWAFGDVADHGRQLVGLTA